MLWKNVIPGKEAGLASLVRSNRNLEELAALLYAGHDLLVSQQVLVDMLSGYVSGDFKIDDRMLFNRLKDSRFRRKSIRPMDDLEKEILAYRP